MLKVKIENEAMIFTVVRVIAIALLLWAYAKHPIGYYTLLRFVICATCAYGTYYAMKLGKAGWMFAMAFVAILFNPVIPIYLKRNQWEIIDAVTALILLLSISLLRRPQRLGQEPEENKELDNRRYESLKTILWGVFWITGACWFLYHLLGNPLDELALIQRGQTVKGYIVDIQESERHDNGGVDYYYTYTYRLPTGREITQETEHGPQDLREDIWDSEQPYPIEVEYLPDDPLTSRIKGAAFNSNSFVGWLGRKIILGSLLLAMFLSPGIGLIRDGLRDLRSGYSYIIKSQPF